MAQRSTTLTVYMWDAQVGVHHLSLDHLNDETTIQYWRECARFPGDLEPRQKIVDLTRICPARLCLTKQCREAALPLIGVLRAALDRWTLCHPPNPTERMGYDSYATLCHREAELDELNWVREICRRPTVEVPRFTAARYQKAAYDSFEAARTALGLPPAALEPDPVHRVAVWGGVVNGAIHVRNMWPAIERLVAEPERVHISVPEPVTLREIRHDPQAHLYTDAPAYDSDGIVSGHPFGWGSQIESALVGLHAAETEVVVPLWVAAALWVMVVNGRHYDYDYEFPWSAFDHDPVFTPLGNRARWLWSHLTEATTREWTTENTADLLNLVDEVLARSAPPG